MALNPNDSVRLRQELDVPVRFGRGKGCAELV